MTTYYVNSSAVNSRDDWRQQLVPGPTPKVEQGFPGEPGRFVTLGRVRPPDLVIVGWLEGASFSDLHDEILYWHGQQEVLTAFSVEIHGSSFGSLMLWKLETVDQEATAFSRGDEGGVLIRQKVRFQWRQLQQ